uniref:NADH-ubiquinone oxidoreductase chain 5 n=1 Tax=Scarturus williamsi TaxID=2926630 RepID=A0A7D3QBL4_9RODE|nr:NADH dehydrogenase subunit 5 [Scarturus williamsi]QKE47112.1 NADH dehydrogenase subunit 5 [Scarturus williamsi]
MNMTTSIFLTYMALLTLPVLSSLNPTNLVNLPLYVNKLIKYVFLLSLMPLAIYLHLGYEETITNWHWITIQPTNILMSFKLDLYSMLFMPVALYVTWSIMEFSTWYMKSDPHLNRFIKYLLMFLITMMILVSANNLMQLFIGWEGVGIMSFLLIGWWFGRSDANTAALQAILYNRIGDIGLILAMAWYMTKMNSWNLDLIMTTPQTTSLIPLLGLLLAAAGKSAQFGLHPWLPSAMEGPTPVSALLHSSTMVVAGVFLLIRFFPILDNPTMKTLMLCLGALTTLFTALCALTQNDIKKIIAFSTSSQLGLMVVTLGVGQPYLAFLHICTHAFFKAMLFLCSGSIIHNLNDEQDIRKMGGLAKAMPFTTTALTIGSLALTGTPFLAGFYSKDLIIEAMNTSYTNAWALTMTLIATSMTAIYSIRIVFFAFMGHPRFLPMTLIHETTPSMINPIKRLMIGSILAGYLITHLMPPIITPPMTMPLPLKTAALMVSLAGLALAMELNKLTLNLTLNTSFSPRKFSMLLGFFPLVMHRLLPLKNLSLSQTMAFKSLDLIWLEYTLPKFLANLNSTASNITTNQKGLMKLYFLSMLLTLPLAFLVLPL